MRENKFRVWCKNKNEWEKDDVVMTESGKLLHHRGSGLYTILKKETHIPVFYTGLKDKNGVEIYEGDIVSFIHYPFNLKRNGIVKYADKWASFYIATKNKYEVGIALTSVHGWYYESDSEDTQCEIIGNIYDNPELIS